MLLDFQAKTLELRDAELKEIRSSNLLGSYYMLVRDSSRHCALLQLLPRRNGTSIFDFMAMGELPLLSSRLK